MLRHNRDAALERQPAGFLPQQRRVSEVSPDAVAGQNGASPLVEYTRLLWSWKWWVLVPVVLGVAGGFASYALRPPVYRAVTTIELQGLNETFMNMNVVDPQAGTGAYSATSMNIATQLMIVQSGSLRAAVHERLARDLTPIAAPESDAFASLRKRLGIGFRDPLASTRAALGQAAGSVRAKNIPGTRMLIVTSDSTNPVIAADFVNGLAAEYMAQAARSRLTNAQRVSQWLNQQVEETRAKLDEAEKQLQAFMRGSGGMFAGDQDTLANTRLRELQAELAKIQADRIAKQSRYEMSQTTRPEALADVLQDPMLRSYQQNLTDLLRQRALLMTTMTARHERVQRVQAQIDEVQRALDAEKASILRQIKSDYQSAQDREKLLAAAYARQSSLVASQADKAAQFGLLKRHADMLRQTLNTMLANANQASMVAAVPTSNARVVDVAGVPGSPVEPNPISQTARGTVLGLCAGCLLGFVREKVHSRQNGRKLHLPGDAGTVLEAPELGVIPSVDFGGRSSGRRPAPDRNDRIIDLGAGAAGGAVADGDRLEMARWKQKPSLLADSFRWTLASIALATRNGKPAHSIVITSPGPGDGKTTVATNLALAMAETGARVLLIDGDLRRPRLHRLFGLANERGLGELVAGKISAEEAVQATDTPGLSVIPAGSADLDVVSRFFDSNRLSELLSRFQQKFGTILIDSPPVLQLPEARLIGRQADGLILVLRAGVTDWDSALSCRQQLADDGIVLLGTILNDWDSRGQKDYRVSRYPHDYSAPRRRSQEGSH